MLLSSLLEILPEAKGLRIENVAVANITNHSGRAEEGSVFVAVRGTTVDGHDFLDEVIKAKPAAIIAERKSPADYHGLWIQVADTRKVLGALAARHAGDHHCIAQVPAGLEQGVPGGA